MVRNIHTPTITPNSPSLNSYSDKIEWSPPKNQKTPKQDTTEKTALQIFHNPAGNQTSSSSHLSGYKFTPSENTTQEKVLDTLFAPFPVPVTPPSPRTLSSCRERALLKQLRNSTRNVLLKEKSDLLKEAFEIDSKAALQLFLEKTQYPLNANTLTANQTLLHLACQGGHTNIISLLASQDIALSLKTRDAFGMTPLDYMRETNQSRALIECANLYISNNQNPKTTDAAKKRNEPHLLLLKFFLLSLESSKATISWVREQLSSTNNKKIKNIHKKFFTKPIQIVPYEIHRTDNAIEVLSVKTLKLEDFRYAVISEGESSPVLLAIPQREELKQNIPTILLKLNASKYLKQLSPNRAIALDDFMDALTESRKWENYCKNYTEDSLLKLESFFHLLPEHCLAHLFERGVNAAHAQLALKALEGIQSKSSQQLSSQNFLRALINLYNKNPELLHFSENSDYLDSFGNSLAKIIPLYQPNEQYELLKFFLSTFRNEAIWKDSNKRLVLFNAFADAFLSNKALTLVQYVLFLKFAPTNLLRPLLNRLPTHLLAQFCIKHECIEKLFEEILSRLENLTEVIALADEALKAFHQNHAKAIETTTQILSGSKKINFNSSLHHASSIPENEWSEEIFGDNLGHIIGHLNNSSFPRTELKTAKFDSNLLARSIPHFENLKYKFSPLIMSKYEQLLDCEKFKKVNAYLKFVTDLINAQTPLSSILSHTEFGINPANAEQIIAGAPNRLAHYINFLKNLQTALTTNSALRSFLIQVIFEKELTKNILHVLYVENFFNETLAGSLLNYLNNLSQLDHAHIELARLVSHLSILLNSSELRGSIIAVCKKLPVESRTDKMNALCVSASLR